jgi:hypothetical protein
MILYLGIQIDRLTRVVSILIKKNLGIQIDRLTRVVSILIKKNLILNIYFESNCLFTYHLGCLFRPAKVIKSY